ncbi:MAG: 2-amino-4-hydroxy-6-hydroxymethyldihydropteridine diphosphokinase [Woeseia sp.]
MTQVYAGIGSNLEPERNLRIAADELRRRFGNVRLSPVYRNPAVGFDGPDFFNLVAGFETDAEPAAIVAAFNEIHVLAGRTRGCDRFVSRALDIDLLLYGNLVSDDPQLPRDDVLSYAFALKPLCDIAPAVAHPQTGRSLCDHWQAMDEDDNALTLVDLDLDEKPTSVSA